jgi:uncharacterized protein YyaL (SSP411 family)
MRIQILSFFIVFFGWSCSSQNQNTHDMEREDHTYTNHLIRESSPYLLQHAHNPVDWHPWGEEALKKAKDENKLLIVSIGYAACHWCHVMEHQSFEDTAVAKIMNENFVCIKVDREERPDIDQIYMDACNLIQKSGGWPLNAFALPDGRPIYAGTYYPKDNWVNLLTQLHKFYTEQPKKALEQAEMLTQGINSLENIIRTEKPDEFYSGLDKKIWENWKSGIDPIWGGRQGAPKFPMPVGWEYLLQYQSYSKDKDVSEAVSNALNKMAGGGIYDQIGGGFARYSVDHKWLAPHFEKMLYDNGQLISLYSNAYKANRNPLYKSIIEESIQFVERELMHSSGGFYSSLDADSEGEEGKFYVWQYDEFINTLKDGGIENPELIAKYYNVSKGGNWEHTNILWLGESNRTEFPKNESISAESWKKTLADANAILMEQRSTRIRPGLDDKILVSWNSLMLKGLCDAYSATGNERYLNMAKNNAKFISDRMNKDSFLYRNYKFYEKKGEATITGFLDDYALFIDALISLYEVTFDEHYLLEAKKLSYYAIDHFFDDKSKMFFYTSDNSEKLIARKMEIGDNVIPSSNSVMAKNLFLLSEYFSLESWKKMSEQMLHNAADNLADYGPYYANWSQLYNFIHHPYYEVAIVGPDAQNLRAEMGKKYLPNVLYIGGKDEGTLPLLEYKLQKGQTTIYVCSGGVCKSPVTTVEEALKLIN